MPIISQLLPECEDWTVNHLDKNMYNLSVQSVCGGNVVATELIISSTLSARHEDIVSLSGSIGCMNA